MPETTAAADSMLVAVSFALYTLLTVAVGLYAARFSRQSNEDYFLAGRSLGPWVAALSASASAESGWVTLGLVGSAFAYGFQAYWIIPGCLLGFLFDWFVLCRPMRERAEQLGALTLPDLLAFHFRERVPILRTISVLIIIASMMAYVASQLAAAGKAFDGTFQNISYPAGVLIGAGIVLLYTVVGGFRAVCWTDFLQALVMVGALFLFPLYLLSAHGGYAFIREQLAEQPQMLHWLPEASGLGLIGFLLGSRALGINFGYPGQPHVLVRFMALREARQTRRAGLISCSWTFLVFWGAITIGLLVRAFYESGEQWALVLGEEGHAEAGLVVAATHLLPGVPAGMVLAAVLSAICSTADSQLVVAASAAASDLYARVFSRRDDRGQVWVSRAAVALLGIGAVLLVIDQKINVYKYVLTYAWAMLGASFGPQVILMLLWKRASYAGCVAGMVCGFVAAIAWPQIYDSSAGGIEAYNLTIAFWLAMIVNVVVSLAAPDRRRAHDSIADSE